MVTLSAGHGTGLEGSRAAVDLLEGTMPFLTFAGVPRATFRLSMSNYSAVQRLRLTPPRSISTLARQFTSGGSSSTCSVSFGRRFCSSSAQGGADLYALLGVSRSATAQEIKRAYFTAAKRTHPDVDPSPGAANRFRALSSAYEVLRDPERRREYDASQSSHAAGSGVRVRRKSVIPRSRQRR